jgi:periplasmic protein CpxP/Spy
MKLFKTTVAVILLAAAGASFAQAPLAQNAARGAHQPGDRIVKMLNLDAARAAQVVTIMTEQRSQAKALWDASKGSTDPAARDAKRAQMKALHDATQAKLATVLTPAEVAQLQAVKMTKHRHHGEGTKPS